MAQRRDLIQEALCLSEPKPTMKSSLAAVMILYLQHAAVLKKTARYNALSLLKILETVLGHPIRAENIPLTDLTPALLSDYQAAKVRAYEQAALKDEPSQREARERALRSSRSTINQARSLFCAGGNLDMPALYTTHGIDLPPNIAAFLSAKVRGRSAKTDYNPPSDAVVESALEQIELMRRDVPVFLAFWLAIGIGLRKKEIRFSRWEHVLIADGKPWYCGGCGKNGDMIRVPIQPRAYEAIKFYQRPDGWIIPQRGDRWARRLALWMTALGFHTRLKVHELRAILGSRIYAQTPVGAMRQLRHSSIQTTERSYVRYALQSDVPEVL